jgi:hypothetical protein
MRDCLEIEDIKAMRLQASIEDIELRSGHSQAGDRRFRCAYAPVWRQPRERDLGSPHHRHSRPRVSVEAGQAA